MISMSELIILCVLLGLLRSGFCCRRYVPDVESEENEIFGNDTRFRGLPFFMNRPVTNYMRHQINVENKCTCGVTNSGTTPRVVGGSETGINEFPFQVALVFKNTRVSFCGGSLINSHFILTAAHCVIDSRGGIAFYAIKKLKDLQILIGAHRLNRPGDVNETLNFGKSKTPTEIASNDNVDGVNRRNPSKVFIHPGYTYSLSTYQTRQIEDDIALIRLDLPVSLTEQNIWTTCLPATDNYDLFPEIPGVIGLIIGWGLTRPNDFTSPAETLQRLEIPIRNLSFCQRPDFAISHHFICINSGSINMDAGTGDSGGPLLVKNTNTMKTTEKVQYIQVGLASFQAGVAASSLYTRVAEYLAWIYSHTDTDRSIKWCKTEV